MVPGAGVRVGEGSAVTLSTTTPDSVLHYTTDGTVPSESSPPYSAPLLIGTTTLLKARP